MFVVFEKNGAIFLVSLCPIAKSSTTKSRFARLDYITNAYGRMQTLCINNA